MKASPIESRSGLPAWTSAEMPDPPRPRGLGWISVVGPGVIVLGLSIGSGEFLLGPATFVRYGFSLLWVTTVAVFLQTVFNTELMRYTLATGEPIVTGFMRTRPTSTFWAWFYAILYILQGGWPAFAANAAGAIYFLAVRRVATSADAASIYLIGVGTYLLCVVVLLFGKRIERTLEILNWVMVTCILGAFLILAALLVPLNTWLSGFAGLFAFDTVSGSFQLLPSGADFVLLAALVAYSGAGGVGNLFLTNWARDKGYGMSKHAGYIPAAVGGVKVKVAHTGFSFVNSPESMQRFRGWWRIVRADQWGVFFIGAMLGMGLPALLYVTFIPRGSDIRGLGIAAQLASNVGQQVGPWIAGIIAFIGAWLLFKSQLDLLEGLVRSVTDILWSGSKRIRAWRGGDVRAVYYSVLGAFVIWGMIALRAAQPIVLLQIAANVAGVVFIIASVHLLYVNTHLLPVDLRPPLWRRCALVAMTLFYGFFSFMSVSALLRGA